ncbi:MAG TPA: serine hydrolase domain-containing protein [Gemmatimonadales bacterium]|nr:serine hydrolase domain-containing protein [Gemmatimonadales bacterium]
MSRVRTGLTFLLAVGCARPTPSPTPAGWTSVRGLLDSAITAGAAPGAVLGVSVRGRHYYYGTGRLGLDDPTRPDSETRYDLASVTKVVSLTTLAMIAVDSGLLDLDAPVVRYLPGFAPRPADPEREGVTIRHLLTHSSGLPAWRPLYQEAATREAAFALADTTALLAPPGTTFLYSDLGAIVLTQVIEQLFRHRIDTLFAERIAQPLDLTETRYLPPATWLPEIAPTENDPWRGRVLRGEVHDENAARLDGVSGNAGLFSSARDLLRFGDWLAEQVDGQTPRHPAGLRVAHAGVFVERQDIPPGSSRALGWDTPSGVSSGGSHLGPRGFGHTGFTGTSIWIDPDRALVIVLLSNRVHPTRQNNRWGAVRGLVADRVVAAFFPEGASH